LRSHTDPENGSVGANRQNRAYDDADRKTCLTLPNGVVVSYGYDNDSRPTSITYGTGGSCSNPPSNLGSLTYSYDADGRRTSMGGGLAAVTLPANVAGGSSTTYNADNELNKFNGAGFGYDDNGNLTSDGVNSYSWDGRGQLTQIMHGSTVNATFTYDGFGRRTSKTVSSTTTQFLYDGFNPVEELNGSSQPLANLLTGLGLDEYFARSDTDTSTFLSDSLGSTMGMVGSGGAIATSYTYEPFGAAVSAGETNGNSYQFTGRENDATGLYYYRYRY
jgi:YD repeat-containing protein